MKTKYAVALAMVGSFVLGAVAVQGLHAQVKPAAYVVIEGTPQQDAFVKEFIPLSVKAAKDEGGKYLALAGKTISFQGAPPAPRIAIIQFENLDKAQAYWNAAATKDAYVIGNKYGTIRLFAVEGVSP